jgi:hypothetical protein
VNFTYAIDDRDRLVAADSGYFSFAARNAWAGAEDSIGKSLWDFVSGSTLRKVQASLLHRIRDTGNGVELPFRCDSPTVRREMTIAIQPQVDGGITFSPSVRSEQSRSRQPLLDRAERGDSNLVEMCGWCDRFLVGGRWVEVEAAATKLGLMVAGELPAISHGLCERCSERLTAA